jgi:hypothetical protein
VETLPALPDSQVDMLLSQALDKGVGVEVLERLLVMRAQLRAESAKEQFDSAMAAFQAECPIIKKTKPVTTKSGQVAYRYAPIDSIVSQVKHLLQKHGFSYAMDTVTGDSTVQAICTVKHNAGHSEQSRYEVPLGERTNIMSASQVVAAALTFASRYAFCNAFGILTGNDDNDARPQRQEQVGFITDAQISTIRQLIAQQTKYTEEQLLQRYGARRAEALTVQQAEQFIEQLKKYISRTA